MLVNTSKYDFSIPASEVTKLFAGVNATSAVLTKHNVQLFFSLGAGGTSLPFSSIIRFFVPSVEQICIAVPVFAQRGVIVAITDNVMERQANA